MKNPNGPSREETDDWKDELAAQDAERAQVKQQWCAICNGWFDHGTWQHSPAETSFAPAPGSSFMSREEYWLEIARLRTALTAARQHILERNGLDRDNDRRAAIAINIALTPNKD